MLDILAGSELLTITVVIALGTLVGIIPFGPVKIGPAGALFVGLAFGALDPRLGQGLDLIRPLGLALFVYTVGLASGATFFSSLRRQLPVMVVGVVVLAVATGLIMVVGTVLGLTSALQGGAFAGSLTSTPALAAATAFLMVGHRSVYASQKIGLSKSAGLDVQLGGPIGDVRRAAVRIRKGSLTERVHRFGRAPNSHTETDPDDSR